MRNKKIFAPIILIIAYLVQIQCQSTSNITVSSAISSTQQITSMSSMTSQSSSGATASVTSTQPSITSTASGSVTSPVSATVTSQASTTMTSPVSATITSQASVTMTSPVSTAITSQTSATMTSPVSTAITSQTSATAISSVSTAITSQTSATAISSVSTAITSQTSATAVSSVSTAITSQTSGTVTSRGSTITVTMPTSMSVTSMTYSSSSMGPTSMVSTMMMTTASANTFQKIYAFVLSSTSSNLKEGIVNDSIALSGIQTMVRSAFSSSTNNFTITLIQATITKRASRATIPSTTYDLGTTSTISTGTSNCNAACVDNQMHTPDTKSVTLLDTSGNSVTAYAYLTTDTIPTLGESPPGVGAQVGMGLGISFIAILIIAEIGFLYWKFGRSATPSRRSAYEMPPYAT